MFRPIFLLLPAWLSACIPARAAEILATPAMPLQMAIKMAGNSPQKPVQIELAGGRYELTEPLVLTTEHQGLTIRAAQGAKPVIAGSVRVEGWKQVDAARGLWQAAVPGVKDGKWRPRQMFVNGARAQRARTPDNAFFHARGSLPQAQPLVFPAQAGTLKPEWGERGDVELIFYQKWIDARLTIKSVDAAANTATLNVKAAEWMSDTDCRYYIENSPEALTAAGEWYLDRKSGIVSYLAPQGMDMARAEITMPRTGALLTIKDCSGITVSGLTFTETDYAMPDDGHLDPQAAATIRGTIRAEQSSDCVIEDCTVTNTGGYALDLGPGCHRWRITGNTLSHCGAGGLRTGESGPENPPEKITFTDNVIAHYGRIHPAAVGVLIMQSGKNRIAHNLIHDGYYTGISVGWTWGYRESPCRENVIEFNHVHTIGQGMLSDMGGIYTLGPQPGTVIRGNWFHDVVSFGYGGWGLYTDEGSSGIVLENNLVSRCKSAGFHQHYGRENIVRNNVFAWCREHSVMRSREEAHRSFTFERNIVVTESGELLGSNWANNQFLMDHNCYWDTRHGAKEADYGFPGGNITQWRSRGHDGHSLFQDPGVPKEGFPRPQNAAVADATGFRTEALPGLDSIGPRAREKRK